MAPKPETIKVPSTPSAAAEQNAQQKQVDAAEELERILEDCRRARECSRHLKKEKEQLAAAQAAFRQAKAQQIARAKAAGYMDAMAAQNAQFQNQFVAQGFPVQQNMMPWNSAPACEGPLPGQFVTGQPTDGPNPKCYQLTLSHDASVHVNGNMYGCQPQNFMPTLGMSAPWTQVQQQQMPYGFPVQMEAQPPLHEQGQQMDNEFLLPTEDTGFLRTPEELDNGMLFPFEAQQPVDPQTTQDEIPECLAVLGLTAGQVRCYCNKCTEAELQALL